MGFSCNRPNCFIGVAAFIFHASYEIYKENSNILLDSAAIDAQDIRDLVMSFEDVKDAHKIRSRSSIIVCILIYT